MARRATRRDLSETTSIRRTPDNVEVSALADDRSADQRAQDDSDEEVLAEARERFNYCVEWESDFQKLYVGDVKFANGDSDNGWQWPDDLRNDRQINMRPALTINKTSNHVALVVNDAKQNKAGIDVRPVGGESSYDAAQVYEGMIRNIEYECGAEVIYYDGLESAVEGGIAYWLIGHDYADDRSFDQVCKILPVRSHMGVFLDPDIKQKSGLDAMYGFVFDMLPRAEYKRKYPKAPIPSGSALTELADWFRGDEVRVADYYRIVVTTDELIYVKDGDREETLLKSQAPRELLASIRDIEQGPVSLDRMVKKRKVDVRTLEWYKIAGNTILERKPLKGKYVPIVRLPGKERVIDGKLERKGLVRGMKDPQRMYNYNSSAQVEYGALQSKSPWVGEYLAFQGHETQWNRANTDNKAFLTFNGWDYDNNRQIQAPQRPEAPGASPAFLQGMEVAARELEMASGQGPAQFGKPTVERSGKAIGETKMQGELITYNFNDNLAMAIETTGIILLDLAPYIYDTKRVVQIMGKDGTQSEVHIDPEMEKAYQEEKIEEDKVRIALNPRVGRYKVQARPGPAYATQRTEAWNAFVQITTSNPEFIQEFGDLMFKSADFPLADKIAERFKRKLANNAPWLLDDNAPNQIQQKLTQQVEQATQIIQSLTKALDDREKDFLLRVARESNEYRKTDISEFDAHTKRIKEVGNAVDNLQDAGDTAGLQALVKQMVQEALSDTKDTDRRAPIPGMPEHDEDSDEDFEEPRRAPDGQYYVKRGGNYYRVNNQMSGTGPING